MRVQGGREEREILAAGEDIRSRKGELALVCSDVSKNATQVVARRSIHTCMACQTYRGLRAWFGISPQQMFPFSISSLHTNSYMNAYLDGWQHARRLGSGHTSTQAPPAPLHHSALPTPLDRAACPTRSRGLSRLARRRRHPPENHLRHTTPHHLSNALVQREVGYISRALDLLGVFCGW